MSKPGYQLWAIVKAHLRARSRDITLLPTDDRITFQATIPLMST